MHSCVTIIVTVIQNISITSESSLVSICSPSPLPISWLLLTTDLLSFIIVLLFLEFHINEIIQYIVCFLGLTSVTQYAALEIHIYSVCLSVVCFFLLWSSIYCRSVSQYVYFIPHLMIIYFSPSFFGYYEESCYEYMSTNLCISMHFHFS